jgi:hypothetical protein
VNHFISYWVLGRDGVSGTEQALDAGRQRFLAQALEALLVEGSVQLRKANQGSPHSRVPHAQEVRGRCYKTKNKATKN